MKYLLLLVIPAFIISCQSGPEQLPILGNHDINGMDTTYHAIPDFSFVNQDSQVVTNATFADKAYVADFFFTSCPTICPKVTKQMLRLHEKYGQDDRVLLLSHTIDVRRDSVPRLKKYATGINVSSDKWHFVTGDKDAIYTIAEDYLSIAVEDERAPGGFDHSGWLILVDKNRRIRSFCDGTKEEAVDQFMLDIDQLLSE